MTESELWERYWQLQARLKAAAGTTDWERAEAQVVSARNAVFEWYWPWVINTMTKYLQKSRLGVRIDEVLAVVAERLLAKFIPDYRRSNRQSFKQFVKQRLVWAVRDGAREEAAWARSPRSRERLQSIAKTNLAHTIGRRPNEHELTEFLGIPEEALPASRGRIVWQQAGTDLMFDSLQARTQSDKQSFLDLLHGLPSEKQRVLYWRFWDGCSIAELAEKLGVSDTHTRRKLRAAVVALRRIYKT
jgi:RNA polymerase sigma factor (sigma-70 family)